MGSALKLDAETLHALEKVARRAGKSPESLARTAVREFVEDYWDMLEVKRRARSRAKTIPWSEVKKQLGLVR
jgi:predicted transcriptional regulator